MEIFFVFGIDFGGKMFSNLVLGEEYEWNYGINLKNFVEGVVLVEWYLESEVFGDFFEVNIFKIVVYVFGS